MLIKCNKHISVAIATTVRAIDLVLLYYQRLFVLQYYSTTCTNNCKLANFACFFLRLQRAWSYHGLEVGPFTEYGPLYSVIRDLSDMRDTHLVMCDDIYKSFE